MQYKLSLRAGRLPPRHPLPIAGRCLPCKAHLPAPHGTPAHHLLHKALRCMQHHRLPTMRSGSLSSSAGWNWPGQPALAAAGQMPSAAAMLQSPHCAC
jgi:hypothetical protein